MWNREDVRRTSQPQPPPAPSEPFGSTPISRSESRKACIGRFVTIKGQISGSEDLTVDGQFEGCIDLPDHTLVVGPNAAIQADIVAKDVIIFGTVVGKVTARQMAELRQGSSLEGDLVGTRIAIQDGAFYTGRVEMTRKPAEASEEKDLLQLVAV